MRKTEILALGSGRNQLTSRIHFTNPSQFPGRQNAVEARDGGYTINWARKIVVTDY
jgi:hypothetical protein